MLFRSVSGLLLKNVCFLTEFALAMSSQESLASPTYYPSSPVGNGHISPIYRPTSPPGRHAWGLERFPDLFHLECPHLNCPGVLAPGHALDETFAPICPGVQPLATFYYKGHHTEGNPFNFISYPISCCQETRTLVTFFLIFLTMDAPFFSISRYISPLCTA